MPVAVRTQAEAQGVPAAIPYLIAPGSKSVLAVNASIFVLIRAIVQLAIPVHVRPVMIVYLRSVYRMVVAAQAGAHRIQNVILGKRV
jgi:hypothetical protein